MKNRQERHPRVRLWLKRLILAVFGIGFSASSALGQESRPLPTKAYLNKGTIQLPVQIDERARPQIGEVHLYVREGPQGAWSFEEKAPSTQTLFTFRAHQEGEYWFSVVIVDRIGRSIPADVNSEPPGMIVVVDGTPPQVDAQTLANIPEGQLIRCDIRDTNLNPSKTCFYYQTRDLAWRPRDNVSGQADVFLIPIQAATTGMIRVIASDLAGNTTTREFDVGHLPLGVNTPLVNNTSLAGNIQLVSSTQPVNNIQRPVVDAPANTSIIEHSDGKRAYAPPDLVRITMKEAVAIKERTAPVAQRVETFSIKPSQTPLPAVADMEQLPEVPLAASSMPVPDNRGMPKTKYLELPPTRHLINNAHVLLNYQIERTGTSGVGRVEIWYTRDLGKTWQKLDEDLNRKGQAEIDLPGEGVYGLTVVVSNGRGFGANPPKSGDAPDWWIEIDITKPQAELLGVGSGSHGDDGSLHITWNARDKNLDSEPVDLFFAANRHGPWLPIAKGLKNDGLYRWTPAADAGSYAFIRMTVHDKAGNSTSCESLQPVPLDDLSRPRGRVTGIITVPRPAPWCP